MRNETDKPTNGHEYSRPFVKALEQRQISEGIESIAPVIHISFRHDNTKHIC